MVFVPITTLTSNQVQQSLQNNGLAALGLTTVSLNRRWADVTPSLSDYQADQMTLAIAGTIYAPFLGVRENGFRDVSSTLASNVGADDTSITLSTGSGTDFPSPVAPGRILLTLTNGSSSKLEIVECTQRSGDILTVERGALGTAKQTFNAGDRVILRLTPAQRSNEFYEADGSSVNVNCTIFRFHPQALLRLKTLATAQYGQPLILPIPVAMIVRRAEGFRAVRWYRPDEILDNVTGTLSFHDHRGMIIDPLYVAGLFADLQTALPGLVPSSITALINGAGGVESIANLAGTAIRVHLIDPHGNPVRIASLGAQMITTDNNGNSTGQVTTNTITLAANNRIAANVANTPLRWGWATNGTMGKTPLVPLNLASGKITRQFYRVMVVDTPWYLLGNRTATQVMGVRADDGRIPADLLPVVRDLVDIDYMVDGPDTLGEATRILTRSQQNMILAVSPFIDQTLITPTAPGATAHWAAFPTPNTNTGFPNPPIALSPTNVTAQFTAGNDVVVMIAANAAPDGAHIRIYPQHFIEITSINGQEPSFMRGDGGANIVSGMTPTLILLRNPFNLQGAQPKPNPAVLTMDIVVAPRIGRRRLTGAVSVTVTAGSAPVIPTDPFFGAPAATIMGILPIANQGVSEQPLFGIPKTIALPANPPASFLDLVVSLMAEESPRQAARLPTMARLETVAVTGTTGAGAQPNGTLLWEAILSGARWSAESRSALHESGNPGNPAAPDVHAPGVSVTGALAYDLALHAIRRTSSIIPRPTGQGIVNPGWVVATGGNNFNEPSDAANTTNTGTGVLLQSIAAGCETPWLSSLTPPALGNTVNQMIQDAAKAIGVPPPNITVDIDNEPRIQQQIRREFFAAKHGFRDAQWSLLRAFSEARELVYIESPQVARTAYSSNPNAPQSFEVDLVKVLKDRLSAHPNLRVIICTPRFSDFAENFRTFHRQHYNARMAAFTELLTIAKERVLLFHPVGFPGRVAYIRTTSIVIDDVWCLVGATHFRRRGMTFDGSAAIASFDRQITDGYSTKVRNYRRALMAAKMNISPPALGQPLSGEWVRLGSPASAFDVVADLLTQGGFGRIQSIWSGPPASDASVEAAQPEVGDPEGSGGSNLFTTFSGMLNELGT
ncbi:hypothetical protein G1O98_26955 [Nostoc sp. UIC10630]|nr:hypothetical protein [Nostoc sp. UIC 10630]NEU82585.1 hypothetical protein [Nostoc sp. UIC 10630]